MTDKGPKCMFCGRRDKTPTIGNPITQTTFGPFHIKCWQMSVVLTAAKRWYAAQREVQEHHHARADTGEEWQYVPERLNTNVGQATRDLIEAVRNLEH